MNLESLSWTQTVLVYVGIPAAIYGVIWFLWALSGWRRQSSYRPGDTWTAAPEWFEGPPSVEGGHLAALEAGARTGAETAPQEGGSSARW